MVDGHPVDLDSRSPTSSENSKVAGKRQIRGVRDRFPAPGNAGAESAFPVLDWPYVEGLRLDEAMNPLAILAVGLYGETLPNQSARQLEP